MLIVNIQYRASIQRIINNIKYIGKCCVFGNRPVIIYYKGWRVLSHAVYGPSDHLCNLYIESREDDISYYCEHMHQSIFPVDVAELSPNLFYTIAVMNCDLYPDDNLCEALSFSLNPIMQILNTYDF